MIVNETQANKCGSCGGMLKYNFSASAFKCDYCGNEYKAVAQSEEREGIQANSNTGYIPFKNDLPAVKLRVMNWLVEGDRTPADIFSEGNYNVLKQSYIPMYNFTGTYTGTYQVVNGKGKKQSEDSISGKFNVIATGIDLEDYDDYESLVECLIESIDRSKIIPFNNVSNKEYDIWASLEEDEAWDAQGKLSAASSVYLELILKHGKSAENYKHYLDYNIESASKVLVPCWSTWFSYNSSIYNIYVNDATGEIWGDKPMNYYISPPAKSTVFKRYALIGLTLWFVLLGCRVFLAFKCPQQFGPGMKYNNILFSNVSEYYWLMRGAIFLVIIPALMSTVFYGWIERRFFEKIKLQRKKELDLILTGKRTEIFN
jgi:predicted RNA-binding Zn-ribbon protein involved in translation (DUF1610 family)